MTRRWNSRSTLSSRSRARQARSPARTASLVASQPRTFFSAATAVLCVLFPK